MGQPSTENAQQIKTMQIITFALIQGVVVFGAIAVFIAMSGDKPVASYMSWIGLALGMMMVVVRTIVGDFLTKGFRTGLDSTVWDEASEGHKNAKLIGNMQTKHIVETAILEAAAIFNCVAYMFEKNIISIVVVIALLILMAITFPSGTKVDQWVDNQKQLINLGT